MWLHACVRYALFPFRCLEIWFVSWELEVAFLLRLVGNMKKFVHHAWKSFASSLTTLTRKRRYVVVTSFVALNTQDRNNVKILLLHSLYSAWQQKLTNKLIIYTIDT